MIPLVKQNNDSVFGLNITILNENIKPWDQLQN